jgi:formate dehydrogenase maturation protein FdhE
MGLFEIVIIVLMLLATLIAVRMYRSKTTNPYVLDTIPGLFPLAGLLFTMLGVAVGLWNFNTENIQSSIPELIDGLKTAFIASMLGILGAAFFQIWNAGRKKVQANDANALTPEAQDMKKALSGLEQILETKLTELLRLNEQILQQNNTEALGKVAGQQIAALASLQDAVIRQTTGLQTEIQQSRSSVGNLVKALESGQQQRFEGFKELFIEFGNELQQNNKEALTEVASQQMTALGSLQDAVIRQTTGLQTEIKQSRSSVANLVQALESGQQQRFEDIKKILIQFGSELQKNNTEALVEVMKKSTEVFNEQMKAIIDKLIQENFEQLNESVRQMNTWQMQNKSMIEELTTKYRNMVDNMEQSKNELVSITRHVQGLAGPASKLAEIVNSLIKLLAEDTAMQQSVEKIKSATESLAEQMKETRLLQDKITTWAGQFKGLEDTTVRLIKSIEDLRDFESDYWKNYRREMNNSIEIFKDNQTRLAEALDDAVKEWNDEYYNHLQSTFANLDTLLRGFTDEVLSRSTR